MPHRSTTSPRVSLCRVATIVLGAVSLAAAHEGPAPPEAEEVHFECPVASIDGTLLRPHTERKVPCVVILGGSLSHDRDGRMARPDAPPRDALKHLADVLAAGGYASLRYDKPGHGTSTTKGAWTGSYADEAQVAAAAIRFARGRVDLGRVIAAGESAGAYLACLAARDGVSADAYVFLGGFCGPGEGIYEYNFARLVTYAESDPERLAWVQPRLRRELALGRGYKDMFAAAAAGRDVFELVDGDFRMTVGLKRRREELDSPPDEMFRCIKAPALALAGGNDLNVPPDHAFRIAAIIRRAGNANATARILPELDHSFQQTPADFDARMRERHTFESFRRPYGPALDRELLAWLRVVAPTPVAAPAPIAAATGAAGAPDASATRTATTRPYPYTAAVTEYTPERLSLAPGITIIDDITDPERTAGVPTLEGRIGPLLLAEGCQAHFLDMPAGMYVGEHPHSSESLIYTVRGQWVLCSGGRRRLMKPGSLFHFARNAPTGYEIPFRENAYILVFKGDRTTKIEEEFIDYLRGMAANLERRHGAGEPFLLTDLAPDHPARAFARKVNPKFDEECAAER